MLCKHTTTERGSSRWLIRFDSGLNPDITIAARLEPGNTEIRDYYLLPSLDLKEERLRFRDENAIELDGYQFDNLSYFFRMAERTRLEELS